MNPSVCAIIPARGGSKGVPGKNLKRLGGIPLLAHTVRAAQNAACVQRIILSTDCEEIAAVGREYGAEVPFLRPSVMAQDISPVADAVRHLLETLLDQDGELPEWIVLLQPTSPFRAAEDIDAAFSMLCRRKGDAIVSVTEAVSHPYLCRQMDSSGALLPFMDGPLSQARRQDLPPAYVLNGALYMLRTERFLQSDSFCPSGAIAYVMPAQRSVDIDTLEDFTRAEWMIEREAEAV